MFAEYREIESCCQEWTRFGSVQSIAELNHQDQIYHIPSLTLGSPDPTAPVLVISGGIHGLERIGTHVAISFIRHLIARIRWDEMLQEHLKHLRIVLMPLMNPVGMHHHTRSNGQGVDLMRNAPIEAESASFLVGGHFISPRLPWYRGNLSQTEEGMEVEAKALVNVVRNQLRQSRCVLALDLHSGFGNSDQLWFPYAKTARVFPMIHQVQAFNDILDQVMSNHVYVFEPQAKNYTTHGDLWDYLYETNPGTGAYLPLTLEMGSWNWIRKNPIQLFSLMGPFNPIKPHRQKRAMRRHLPLFDFMMHATSSHSVWTKADPGLRSIALEKWY
jgi:hypothetical protein